MAEVLKRAVSISLASFLPVYKAGVSAGQNAKQIAATLFGVELGAVTDKQVASVSQRATNARTKLREQNPDLTDEQILSIVPKLENRIGSATDFLAGLVKDLKVTQEKQEEQPETPSE